MIGIRVIRAHCPHTTWRWPSDHDSQVIHMFSERAREQLATASSYRTLRVTGVARTRGGGEREHAVVQLHGCGVLKAAAQPAVRRLKVLLRHPLPVHGGKRVVRPAGRGGSRQPSAPGRQPSAKEAPRRQPLGSRRERSSRCNTTPLRITDSCCFYSCFLPQLVVVSTMRQETCMSAKTVIIPL